MDIASASLADLDEATSCLAAAFAQDPITGFLLQNGPGYRDRVKQFFSLLLRARIGLQMPVRLARDSAGIQGAVMGYSTLRPDWPLEVTEDWDRFEKSIPGFTDRMSVYEGIAVNGEPREPHYYLGVIGTAPELHGRGIGTQLLKSFCELSASDPLSRGVYLETAHPSNVGFYQRAGFEETARGDLGNGTLWCMFLRHGPR